MYVCDVIWDLDKSGSTNRNLKVWLGVKPKNSDKLWSGDHMITQNDDEMNVHNWIGVGGEDVPNYTPYVHWNTV